MIANKFIKSGNVNKFKVSVTGGIGSGKTMVCKIFEILGWPVYYSDSRAMELVQTTPELVSLYCRLFGNDVFQNGVLKRQQVAKKIFSNPNLLVEVQNAVHPMVRDDFNKWASLQDSRVVINESAISFESGLANFMNQTVLIVAPEPVRITRVMIRDNVPREVVESRMRAQWSDEEKIKLADYLIHSDDQNLVIPQVIDIFNKIVAKSEELAICG